MTGVDSLTPEQRAWLVRDEERWKLAYEIAARHRDIDVCGVYRVLRNLERTPTERLRAGLEHGRLFRLHSGERAVLEALNRHGVRFMLVGLSAAILQGANTGTRDIDMWFEDTSDPRIGEAVREANGIWISGSFGMRPPQIGGDEVGDRLDVVTYMHGLGTFIEELVHTREVVVDGIALRILRLERIIASKRAAGRKKDLASIPALEEALAATEAATTRDDT